MSYVKCIVVKDGDTEMMGEVLDYLDSGETVVVTYNGDSDFYFCMFSDNTFIGVESFKDMFPDIQIVEVRD